MGNQNKIVQVGNLLTCLHAYLPLPCPKPYHINTKICPRINVLYKPLKLLLPSYIVQLPLCKCSWTIISLLSLLSFIEWFCFTCKKLPSACDTRPWAWRSYFAQIDWSNKVVVIICFIGCFWKSFASFVFFSFGFHAYIFSSTFSVGNGVFVDKLLKSEFLKRFVAFGFSSQTSGTTVFVKLGELFALFGFRLWPNKILIYMKNRLSIMIKMIEYLTNIYIILT